jgi:hypothetical protein
MKHYTLPNENKPNLHVLMIPNESKQKCVQMKFTTHFLMK